MADGGQRSRWLTWSEWVRLRTAPALTARNGAVSIADLFSGCGGMTLGAREGARRRNKSLEIKLAVDINRHALSVYCDNFEVDPNRGVCADINSIFPGAIGSPFSFSEATVAEHVGQLDVLLAGPPCQGHSDLNNRSRRADPRNGLYLAAIRAVEVLRPTLVVLENVPTVVHDRGDVTTLAHLYLGSMGYQVAAGVVAFSEFGLAQTRRRHVTLASEVLSSGELEELLVPRFARRATVRDFIEDLEDSASDTGCVMDRPSKMSHENKARAAWLHANQAFDLPNQFRPSCHKDKPHSYVSMYGRLRWDKPAQTITTGFGSMGQGRYLHPSRIRTLTCREAARIQGFPDFFDFGEARPITELRQMIGNAVPPQFVASVVESVFR